MKRGVLSPLKAFLMSGKRLIGAFWRQNMALALLMVLALFALSLVFAFLAAAPVLSPFVYPMF